MNLSEEAVQSALGRLDQLLALGESVQGSDVTVPMPRLVPLTMTANGAVEMLAELGVCPADQLAEYRTRLERLGVQRSAATRSRVVGGGGTFSSTASATSPTERETGGAASVDEWQRRQIRETRTRLQRPVDELPAVLPLSLVLGRSDTVAVVLVQADVYTTGISWLVWTHGRGQHPPFLPTSSALAERMGRHLATAPDVTVTFDDGRASVAIDRLQPTVVGDQPADGVVLLADSGNGNDNLLRRDYWLTPRPTGPVTIDFAWPEQGLQSTRHTVDVADVIEPTPVWP